MATIWESLEASGGNAGRARFGLFFLVVEPGPPSLLFRFFGAMLRLGAKGRGPGCCGAAAAVGDLPIKIHLSILEFGEKNRVWGGPVRTRRRCEKLREAASRKRGVALLALLALREAVRSGTYAGATRAGVS